MDVAQDLNVVASSLNTTSGPPDETGGISYDQLAHKG